MGGNRAISAKQPPPSSAPDASALTSANARNSFKLDFTLS